MANAKVHKMNKQDGLTLCGADPQRGGGASVHWHRASCTRCLAKQPATPTDVQIGALKQLARYYGDHGLASTCNDALDGNREALEVVANEIAGGGWL